MSTIQNNPSSRPLTSAPSEAPARPATPAAPAGPAAAAGKPAAPAKADSFQTSAAGPNAFSPGGAVAGAPAQLADIQKARAEAGLKSTAPVLSPEMHNPARTTISAADIKGLEKTSGRELSVGDLAKAFPNARINGKGATLSEITKKPVGKTGMDGAPVTLGSARVDKNGDLDVSNLFRQEIASNNQNLLMKKGDEFPVPLEHTIRNSQFLVGEGAHRQALAGAGFPSKGGALSIDMGDMGQVKKALQKVGVDPANGAQVAKELQQQGVKTPMSADDQLRRVLVGKLDSANNVLDINDKLVERAGDHNQEIQPTVYSSAKVSPENLDSVILAYKRFNNQSYAGQGSWVTEVLGKDKKSQHEFDAEATFVKINTGTHELEQVMSARHYFGEVYDKKAIDELKKRTGRDDLTTSVSYLAHGSRLAENGEKKVWAGHGDDGVKWYDPRDHVLKDEFMGLKDAEAGKAILIPKEKVNLVVESDDQQSLNLKTHFGETRAGILGTKIMDIYNDGMPPDRFFGTEWYYQHEKLATEKSGFEKKLDGAVDTVKDLGRGVVDTAKDIGRGAVNTAKKVGNATAQGYTAAKKTVGNFLKKLVDW